LVLIFTGYFVVEVKKPVNIMLKQSVCAVDQGDLYRSGLSSMLDLRHRLVKLAHVVDWSGLEESFSVHYCADNGRPGEPIRLMAGLLLLKATEGISDEDVCRLWSENPYWQYFCGEMYFVHGEPVTPENLVHFRKRIGEAGMERLLAETVRLGLLAGVVKKKTGSR
jgi:transposase, IS5 family